jgi:hypothetical protein
MPVSSPELMHAGLPCDQFAFGGADWGKTFVLDERNQLTKSVAS